jgi:hypothetical protein
MERRAAVARYEALHKGAPFHDGKRQRWSATRSDETPYHFSEGVEIVATAEDLGLGGDFLRAPADRDDDFDED